MTTTPDFPVVFDQLKAILKPYEPRLSVTVDSSEGYSLDTHQLGPNKKPMFFGAAVIKKNYVSFHLMPVYAKPELLDALSPALKSRMQGKSCFNFAQIDQPLFQELATLTKAGFASYEEQGFV